MTPSSREQAARALLKRLSANATGSDKGGWAPAWSSSQLEQMVAQILSAPDGAVADVFRALWAILGESRAEPSDAVVNLVRDLVRLAFTQYRSRYEAEDFQWMADALKSDHTPAQAFLALYALPKRWIKAARARILGSLSGSRFFDEARRQLE